MRRNPGKRRRLEKFQAVVDMPHRGGLLFLVVSANLAIGKFDVAGIEQAVILKDRHQPQSSRSNERLLDRAEIAGQVRVAVHDEEGVTQQGQRLPQRSGGSQQFVAVLRVTDVKPEAVTIADEFLDHATQVRDAEHDLGDALTLEQP